MGKRTPDFSGDRTESPTTLREDELWELDVTLAELIGDALMRRCKGGKSFPAGVQADWWYDRMTFAAHDFIRYATVRNRGDDPEPPYEGLAFIALWWRDLWD